MADVRVPVGVLLTAFGVPATVTRPAPDTTPIATTRVWLPALEEPQPYGTDFQRREPRRRLALPRSVLPTLPRGTSVAAPEIAGAAVKTWTVDGLERAVDPDFWFPILTIG